MRQKILVLDGDAGAALTIVQSLGRAGYEVWLAGVSRERPAFASRYVAAKAEYPDPLSDKDTFIAWLLAIQDRERFALIIPPTDRTITPLHEVRAQLGAAAVLPPASAFEIGFDKERVRRLAAELGIPTPENRTLTDREQLRDPIFDAWLARGAVVCKSVRSKSWRGAVGSENPVTMAVDRAGLDQCGAAILEHADLQLQPWLPGCGYGVEVLVDHGEVVLTFAHERLHELPLTGGGSSYRRALVPPPRLLADARRLMEALGWHGVAMVEFRLHGDDYWMIELNGRFWGSLPLAQFAGVDFPLALVRLLLDGERPVQPPTRLVRARQLGRDLEWLKAMVRLRANDVRRLGGPPPPRRRLVLDRSLLVGLLEWGRILGGHEVWDGAALDDWEPIAREVVELVGAHARKLQSRTETLLMARRAVRRWRQRTAGERILVLCSGNICRSPYAAELLGRLLGPRGVTVRSAALTGPSGRSSPAHLLDAARARGVELSGHRSRAVEAADVSWADLVLVMDARHELLVKERWPEAHEKTRWLGAAVKGGPEIADPIDLDRVGTDRVLDHIERASKRLVELLSR